MTPPLLSVGDVATITGLSEYTIRQAIRDLDLPATKLRGRLRIHPDDLAAWIDAGRVQPSGTLADVHPFQPAPRPGVPADGFRAEIRRRRKDAA